MHEIIIPTQTLGGDTLSQIDSIAESKNKSRYSVLRDILYSHYDFIPTEDIDIWHKKEAKMNCILLKNYIVVMLEPGFEQIYNRDYQAYIKNMTDEDRYRELVYNTHIENIVRSYLDRYESNITKQDK
jgi:hypothetical protein